MNLTEFLGLREVRDRIKPLRPKGKRRISVPVRVPATDGKRSPLVGTAFDYLLRFELLRRAPHAKARPWIAELVPALMTLRPDAVAGSLNPSPDRTAFTTAIGEAPRRVQQVIDDAKKDVAAFRQSATPDGETIATVAGHALRLAKLDCFVRVRFFDATFQQAAAEDIETLTRLLAIVPFDQLAHPEVLMLNPTFGDASREVGGADADIIAGDMLVDVKTRKDAEVDSTTLDQLLGYLILARRHRKQDQSFPEIRRVGVYLSRYGHLWTAAASDWTSHPVFAEVEQWFFEKAGQVVPMAALRLPALAFVPGAAPGLPAPPWLDRPCLTAGPIAIPAKSQQ
ncbi:MAG TPA: hypothetical protein VH120_16360 [Gemmataceae bacterium]|jgi:hypothetical protein|nr:hypothetical protein [Gemmataceae bacterium]